MKRILLYALLVLALYAAPVRSQTTATIAPEVVSSESRLRQQTFEKVWSTVNEKHFDPTFGGVDWKKVGETYEPKALSAKTDAEFYDVLQDMLGELHQSH